MRIERWLGRAVSLAACALALGCGGGGNSSGGGATPPPALAVVSSTPASSTNVDAAATASVTFNTDIDATTVSSTSLTLTGPVGTVASNRTTSNATVALTPQAPLVWGTRYTLSATTALKDKNGQSLASPFQQSFDTTEPTWSSPTELSFKAGSGIFLASDGKDNVFAVWGQFSELENRNNVFSARMDGATRAWSAPVQINAGIQSLGASDLIIAADAQGNAVAAWTERSASNVRSTYAARFDRLTGVWGAPVAVRAGATGVTPELTVLRMDAAGNTYAMGHERTTVGSSYKVFVRRMAASTGLWSEVSLFGLSNYSTIPSIGHDAKGNAMLVWWENNTGGTTSLSSATYDVVTDKWSTPQSAISGIQTARAPGFAMDATGNATMMWAEKQSDGRYVTTVARYDVGTGKWGASQKLSANDGSTYSGTLVMDTAGNATAIWAQSYWPYSSTDVRYSLNTTRYNVGSGTWGAVQQLDSVNYGAVAAGLSTPYSLERRVDLAGNVVVAWFRSVTLNDYDSPAFVSRYSASKNTWQPAARIGNGIMDSFSTAIDRTGSVFVMWREDATGNFYDNSVIRYFTSRLSGKP